ncbi:DinB family protein [Dietzia sp. B32]|uniref:DinB family protein n=1 Tax=Dietzia sp. B32 TaxID=2915130 RepID=UPI0021ADD4A5|nr:DinB family protein [Dietzia sp. B32]UVE96282.1 DinB family protein [Dietzia sp. B32]
MPLFPATRDTERENLLEWIDAALVNARSIVHGLTGDQLRTCPVPTSELTLGWLILHIGEVAEGWLGRAAAAPDAPDTGRSLPEQFAWAKTVNRADPDATAEEILAEFDRRHAAALEHLRDADLDAPVPVPTEMPWFPPGLPPFNGRWAALHALNEIARHSGHADILREAVDNRTMYELIAEDQSIDMSYIGAWFAAHPEVPAPQW